NALGAANQVGAACQVAPLVTAARLKFAVVLAVQFEEVVALQDLVAELGVTDALFRIQSRGDGILFQHCADAEVLADFSQEINRRQRRSPIEVVYKPYRVVALR